MAELNPLDAAQAEYDKLQREITEAAAYLKRLEQKMLAVEKTIEILRPVYDSRSDIVLQTLEGLDGIDLPDGITDGVRAVLQSVDHYLTPMAVRDGLKQTELLKEYPNEMAVVHQVLKRLEKQGQAETREDPTHGKVYRWKRRTLQDLAGTGRYRSGDQLPQAPPPPDKAYHAAWTAPSTPKPRGKVILRSLAGQDRRKTTMPPPGMSPDAQKLANTLLGEKKTK